MPIDVQHGFLTRVLGCPQISRGIWFSAAGVVIDEPECQIPLSDFIDPPLALNGDFDFREKPLGLWLRARISVAFGYRPIQVADGGPRLLDHGFVAVSRLEDEHLIAAPFACSDHECCNPEIAFSDAGPNAEERVGIVKAFCELLTRITPHPFIAEGIGWALFDYEAEVEAQPTQAAVGFDGDVYYNADFEYHNKSWLMPDGEPTKHVQLRVKRRTRRCT